MPATTAGPTPAPTTLPTADPTIDPSPAPTTAAEPGGPSPSPTVPATTAGPTPAPTTLPTADPTIDPSPAPTTPAELFPTSNQTAAALPTADPALNPTQAPTTTGGGDTGSFGAAADEVLSCVAACPQDANIGTCSFNCAIAVEGAGGGVPAADAVLLEVLACVAACPQDANIGTCSTNCATAAAGSSGAATASFGAAADGALACVAACPQDANIGPCLANCATAAAGAGGGDTHPTSPTAAATTATPASNQTAAALPTADPALDGNLVTVAIDTVSSTISASADAARGEQVTATTPSPAVVDSDDGDDCTLCYVVPIGIVLLLCVAGGSIALGYRRGKTEGGHHEITARLDKTHAAAATRTTAYENAMYEEPAAGAGAGPMGDEAEC